MKVLISDNLSPRGVEILKKAGLDVDFRSKTSAEESRASRSTPGSTGHPTSSWPGSATTMR